MPSKSQRTGPSGFYPLRKARVALSGLHHAVVSDFAVAYKVVLSVVLLAVLFYFRQWLDFGLVLVASALMLVAEMFNTAIEALCDFVEEKQNPKIGVIKDIAAAATSLSIVVWVIILGIEIFQVWEALGPSGP